jgi:inhibitor of KinA sporulation pathway (predicted exonuclease)
MSHLIIDLEWTCCDKGSIPEGESETIEIGAVLIDDKGELASEFGSFVRPLRHPVLTGFCTSLTSIGQGDVELAKPFVEVWLYDFLPWLGKTDSFCSWGKGDLRQFKTDCVAQHVPFPFARHCDLWRSLGKTSHRHLMKRLGVEWRGSRHRAMDDARNYARMVAAALRSGYELRYGDIPA